jgi:hypothetical protein
VFLKFEQVEGNQKLNGLREELIRELYKLIEVALLKEGQGNLEGLEERYKKIVGEEKIDQAKESLEIID